jgi:NAD(P)-dependent dehydrogenase (short-subunit alcohol dehydrogenase family)
MVTGSSRGIGFGLATAFLDLGCSVVVSGSNQVSTDHAVAKLSESYRGEMFLGKVCDVRDPRAIQSLWDAAKDCFGQQEY